jgi:hypothetical protein
MGATEEVGLWLLLCKVKYLTMSHGKEWIERGETIYEANRLE